MEGKRQKMKKVAGKSEKFQKKRENKENVGKKGIN